MEEDKINVKEAIKSLLLVIIIGLLIIICVMDASSFLSRDEICQKNFGKDYIWQSGYRSADFCVDSSGVPKYPKTWNERKPNA
jgi:hypothetical protein|nr:MAG TPA: hypothetical protein [Caudoviricetes sp.]